MKRLSTAAAVAVVAAALAVAACGRGDDRAVAERRLLERELANLEALRALPADSPLVARGDVVVALRSELFEAVLERALPQSGPVGDRYRLTLETASVDVRSGLVGVEMQGRAALRDDRDVYADVAVVGLLEVIGVDPATGVLDARVEILGVDTRQVSVQGLSPPAERLVNALARRRSEEFDELLGQLEIPVSLRERIALPAVDVEALSAEGGRLPLRVALRDARALGDRLWLAIDLELGAPVTAEPASWWQGGARSTPWGQGS